MDTINPSKISDSAIVRVSFTGEMNYLTIDKQSEFLKNLHHVSAVILSFRATADVDMDAVEMLEDIIMHFKEVDTDVYLVGLNNDVKNILSHSAVISALDQSHFLPTTTNVLELLNHA